MFAIRNLLAFAVISCSSVNTLQAQSRTQNGATAGGLAGAVIGGIIGKQNDETPEGILIGGAVGAITGGLIGKAQDNELARQRAFQQRAYYQQQQQFYAQQHTIANSGVSSADLVAMTRSGLSESLIMSQLQTKGVPRRLEVSDIISLHQQGVSDHVIATYQSSPLATQIANPSREYAGPMMAQPPVQQVIVREQPVLYSSPVFVQEYYHPVPVHRHYYRPAHRSAGSYNVRF